MSLDRIEDAIEDIREGRIVIVVDEEDRENEGDLTMAAEKVTPEAINFMATHGRGLICMPMREERLDALDVPLMVKENQSAHGTAFCVSIEARNRVSTGISAADRAITILTAIDPKTCAADLIKPGHVFPLRARPGGVLERAGQTEAAVDLAQIAGLAPAGVICEIMNADGTMARLPDLERFRDDHGVKIVSVVDLIRFRLRNERLVGAAGRIPFESELGSFEVVLYENRLDGDLHLAFVKGDPAKSDKPVLVRVHKETILGDTFLGTQDSAGGELRGALSQIEREGCGVLVYLRLEGKQELLRNEFEQYEASRDTQHSQSRTLKDHGIGAQILADLGLTDIRILTNHPKKVIGLDGFKLNIVDQIPIAEAIRQPG